MQLREQAKKREIDVNVGYSIEDEHSSILNSMTKPKPKNKYREIRAWDIFPHDQVVLTNKMKRAVKKANGVLFRATQFH